jgi:hypothetical membrane protein
MPARSRPYPDARAARDEGSDRPAPLSNRTRLLLGGGLIAPIIFVGGFLVEGAIQPGYNPWTDYVSDLSLGADGWMQVASFIICGWLLLGFSAALCELAETRLAPAWTPVLFSVMAFGLIGAGAFEIDPATAQLTLHGELHYMASFIIAGSLGMAALLAGRDLRHEARRAAPAAYCLASGLAVVALFTASLLAPDAAPAGLLERLALILGSGWVVVYAQRLRRTLSVSRHEFERKLVAA